MYTYNGRRYACGTGPLPYAPAGAVRYSIPWNELDPTEKIVICVVVGVMLCVPIAMITLSNL